MVTSEEVGGDILDRRIAAIRARLDESDSESEVRREGQPKWKVRRHREPLPADAWKRYTPEKINERKCQARVCNQNKGGQCSKLSVSP